MKNYLKILYTSDLHDQLFGMLKQEFGASVQDVSVDSLVPDSLVEIKWDDDLNPIDIATKLTEAMPSILIDTPSNTGIDTNSRFFNSSQLW